MIEVTDNMFDLQGKVVLLTGATRGLSGAIASAMAAHGATLPVSDRDADATEASARAPCAKRAAQRGRWPATWACRMPPRRWPTKRSRPQASIAGLSGNRAIGVYGPSKAALSQLARHLAVEWGPRNVRANAITPGLIRTPLSRVLMADAAFIERRLAATPLRRAGEPVEVAGMAVLDAYPRSTCFGFLKTMPSTRFAPTAHEAVWPLLVERRVARMIDRRSVRARNEVAT